MSANSLTMWVIYERPKDYPQGYLARRWEITRAGPTATDDVMRSAGIETLRIALANNGMTQLARSEVDEPQIVETWL